MIEQIVAKADVSIFGSDRACEPISTTHQIESLETLLEGLNSPLIACSGGIDSLLLATIAHRQLPEKVVIAHAVSPAVPPAATERVKSWAQREGWNLFLVKSGEFATESYLSNPVNRCYFCKTNLYQALSDISLSVGGDHVMMSGANTDDLGEYRPGLIAADENSVRHPYIECRIDKLSIRAMARHLLLPFADLPASPCLASRLYTGTRVTPTRLNAVDKGENYLREKTGIEVVRCRIIESEMLVEVSDSDRTKITPALLQQLTAVVLDVEPTLRHVRLDPSSYRPGRAFVQAS